VSDVRGSSGFDRFPQMFETHRQVPPRNGVGFVDEAARRLPIYHKCDVLVVGGGPSGTAAAVAAARAGADVVLLERYNHLGGLSTGGLVIWIDRMTDWEGTQVIAGFAKEIFDRLPPDAVAGPPKDLWGSQDPRAVAHWQLRTSAFHGVVNWAPTIDPERLKLLSQEMLLEAGVRIVFHSWAAAPIVEDGAVTGVVFESKGGRQALLAKVVVDATGDGDIFARAGAEFDADVEVNGVHHAMNTAFLLGGVDMPRWLTFRSENPERYDEIMKTGRERLGFFAQPYVSWRDDIALFVGPRQAGLSALDVDDMTDVEIRSRRLAMGHTEVLRELAPGFEHAYLLQGAPQLGVRHTRRLVGVGRLERSQWETGIVHADEVGVSPSMSPKFPPLSVPYGSLVPRKLDQLLACGRHISCDVSTHSLMREIPQCWLTGQAAGVAAAVAISAGLAPRNASTDEIRATLRKQGAYLNDTAAADRRTSALSTAAT
jgi:glycine/D-amino acid oxidase-like deaminating enzyme